MASKAVTAGLLLIACLGVFFITLNFDLQLTLFSKEEEPLNIDGPRISKGVDRSEVYDGRPARTTSAILEKAEIHYQRIVGQRKTWLTEENHGKR